MAKAQLILGGELDIATADEVVSAVNGAKDSILSKLNRPQQRVLRKRATTSAVAATATTAVLDFGAPPSGSMWAVVGIVVMGGDDRTTVTGATAVPYIGNVYQPGLGMVLAEPKVPPQAWTWSKETVFAHSGQAVFVNVYGAANLQQLVGVLTYHEYHPSAAEELTVM